MYSDVCVRNCASRGFLHQSLSQDKMDNQVRKFGSNQYALHLLASEGSSHTIDGR